MSDAKSTVATKPPKAPRSKPTKQLPTDRVTLVRQLEILLAYAIHYRTTNKPVTNDEVAETVGMTSTTVSTCNPFLADIGLIQKSDSGNAHLISNGWNKDVEIKATNLWHAPKNQDISANFKYKNNPEVPMKVVLESIAKLDGYIESVVIKLDTVNPNLQTAPCAILYNYFAWQLLKGPLCYFPAVELFADQRNREYHNLLKFDGYIESQAQLERAEKGKKPLNPLLIHHYNSNSANAFTGGERAGVEYGVRGLEAADFVCWAIKRKYENGDPRRYSIIEPKIKWNQALYFDLKTLVAKK